MKTVWVDKLLGEKVGSVAFKRTASSEVECFGRVPTKIKSEEISILGVGILPRKKIFDERDV